MPTVEQQIDAEMRMFALETIVDHLWAAVHAAEGRSPEQVLALAAPLLENAGLQPFVGLDPALSDHAAALLQQYLEAAFRRQAALLQGSKQGG